jgi:drug/metabolite transporter (DMT)-like permease
MAQASRPLAAAGSVVAAMALLGLTDNMVQQVAGISGVWQFHLVRSLMALPVLVLMAWSGGRRIAPQNLGAVALRSLLVSVSMVFYFGSLAFLSVSEAAAGLFTAPIFVLLISVFVLGETFSRVNVLAVILGFAGVLLVLRPAGDAVSLAVLMPLAAGLFYALGAIATRRLCADEGTFALLGAFFVGMALWGALGCVVLGVVQPVVPAGADGFLLRGWVAPDARFLGLVAIQAVGAVVGVGLIIRGYLLAEAGFVAVFEYALLVFGAVWAWVLWGDVIDLSAAAGIVLIILSGGVLARHGR